MSPCQGVSPSGATVTIDTANGGVDIDGTLYAIGTATRADIAPALGPGVVDGTNMFWSNYCTYGLQLQYVDDTDQGGVFLGMADGGDTLARVVVLPESNATTSEGVSIGQQLTETQTELSGASSYSGPFGTILTLGSAGLIVEHDLGGNAHTMYLGTAQAAGTWGTRFDLLQRRIGPGGGEVRIGDDTFGQLEGLLGTGWDQEGEFPVDGQDNGFLRIWATLGVRAAGGPGANAGDSVLTLFLSPPFLGQDDSGVGVGSTRTAVEAALGAVEATENGLELYDCQGGVFFDTCVGISYRDPGGTCEERAQAIILDYILL